MPTASTKEFTRRVSRAPEVQFSGFIGAAPNNQERTDAILQNATNALRLTKEYCEIDRAEQKCRAQCSEPTCLIVSRSGGFRHPSLIFARREWYTWHVFINTSSSLNVPAQGGKKTNLLKSSTDLLALNMLLNTVHATWDAAEVNRSLEKYLDIFH